MWLRWPGFILGLVKSEVLSSLAPLIRLLKFDSDLLNIFNLKILNYSSASEQMIRKLIIIGSYNQKILLCLANLLSKPKVHFLAAKLF